MTYAVYWHPNVDKFLAKLPPDVSGRIVSKVREVAENPFRYVESLEGYSAYKLRVGVFRLIVDVDRSAMTLSVQDIDHRSRVYDR